MPSSERLSSKKIKINRMQEQTVRVQSWDAVCPYNWQCAEKEVTHSRKGGREGGIKKDK